MNLGDQQFMVLWSRADAGKAGHQMAVDEGRDLALARRLEARAKECEVEGRELLAQARLCDGDAADQYRWDAKSPLRRARVFGGIASTLRYPWRMGAGG